MDASLSFHQSLIRASCPVICVIACAFQVSSVLVSSASAQSNFVNWESPQVHPLEVTPSGNRLLAVNTADNRLEVFDISASGGIPVLLASIPVGLDPVSVRARSNTEAWVANLISDSISIVDLSALRVIRTVTVGDEPCDIAFAGSPQRAFITLSQLNQVRVIDPLNPTAAGTTIAIAAEDPRALAVSPDGTKVYAAIFESGNHSVIIPRAAVNSTVGPYGGANPPANSGTQFVPARTAGQPTPPKVAHIARKNSAGQWLDGNNRNWTSIITWDVLDHDVAIIDTTTLAVSYANGLMTTVAGISVRPDGRVCVVGSEARNEIRFESNLNGKFIRSEIASFAQATPSTIQIADINPHLTYTTSSIPILQRAQSIGDPRSIVWDAAGARAYVCGIGSNIVVATDVTGARLATFSVGEGASGLALSFDGSRLYTLNRFSGSISTSSVSSLVELARTSFYDPTPAAIRDGRPFMFDTHLTSGLGQASCASCHLDTRTDHLAWDLGNPAGEMISFNQTCVVTGQCVSWHPMKGPLVTQTLQGIIGNEPLHWRGEKPGIEDFNSAFTNLQAADALLSTSDMAKFKAYVATITFPPNPNRAIDNTLSTAISTSTGTGSALAGKTFFETFDSLPNAPGSNTKCVDCHPGSSGTSLKIGLPLGVVEQNRKTAQMRNLHEKTGANIASTQATRGFGFNHDAEFSTFTELFNVGFTFGTGAIAATRRRDVEAYLLSFSGDTHAGVGAQAFASNAGGTGDETARITQMRTIADTGQVGLIVKGRVGNIQRGYSYVGGAFQSDRSAEILTPTALLALAGAGSELTYTLVPLGSTVRIGIDRDGDGFYDRDEIDAGSDPANPNSVPNQCVADINHDGAVTGSDLAALLGAWGTLSASNPADFNHDLIVDGNDLTVMLSAWGNCN